MPISARGWGRVDTPRSIGPLSGCGRPLWPPQTGWHEMNTDKLWDEMLDEFRALGGVAENVRLGRGAFGRGLFPVDPKKPVRISIPNHLLVAFEDVTFDNNAFRVLERASIGARARAFLEQYERDFSWGTGREETERFLYWMNELPEDLKEFLTGQLGMGRFFQRVTQSFVQDWF